MEQLVYLNGSIVPKGEAKVSPFDYGFLYGFGLFETMRAYGGHLFRLSQHVKRLKRSAEILGLAEPLGRYDLERACLETLRANTLGDARLRLTVTAGEGAPRPDLSTCSAPTVLVSAQAYVPLLAEVYSRGYRATVSSLHRNSQSPLSRLKVSSYMENLLARREALLAGTEEALFLNENGFLAEGSLSNIFLVVRDGLITPSLGSAALPGITREAVLELASSLGIEAQERPIALEELLQADEAFLTNSLMEVMPLVEVGDRAIGQARPGLLTLTLATAYRKLVDKEASSRY